jgi:hypothetical protein
MSTTQTGYPIPPAAFDPVEWARNKILRANQLQELILQQFMAAYQDFWGVADPPNGSVHTVLEMQAIINAMPQATALDIMQDSRGFSAYIESAYPDVLPAKYQDSAFDVTITNNTIIVGSLKPAWAAPQTEAT